VIERVLTRMPKTKLGAISDVLAADSEARRMACEEVDRMPARAAAV